MQKKNTRQTSETQSEAKYKKPTAAILRLLSEAPTPDLIPARNYRATLPDLPKDAKKRQAKLHTLLAEYETALKRDVERYDELCRSTAEDIERQWIGNEPHYNLQLKINHISYHKQHINAVLEQLGRADRFEGGDSPKIDIQLLEWKYPEAQLPLAEKSGNRRRYCICRYAHPDQRRRHPAVAV